MDLRQFNLSVVAPFFELYECVDGGYHMSIRGLFSALLTTIFGWAAVRAAEFKVLDKLGLA